MSDNDKAQGMPTRHTVLHNIYKDEEMELGCASNQEMLNPAVLLPLLECAVCTATGARNTLLDKPITLSCGHSCCSHHVCPSPSEIPSCPVKGCSPESTIFANGPITLSIAAPSARSTPVGTDVRLAQIVTLVLELAPIFSTESTASREDRAETRITRVGNQPPGQDRGPSVDSEASNTIPTEKHSEAALRFNSSLLALTTCAICLNTLDTPITTCCQHTFCSTCLFRAVDQCPNCPICRHQFDNVAEFYEYGVHRVLTSILAHVTSTVTLPAVRRNSDDELDTPIFVSQLSFPGMPTILHVFEPRYRLMLRRILASRELCFGMIMHPSREGQAVNYGTMLEVSHIHILPDGRSIVQTIGTYRFRIAKRKEFDGYLIAKVDRFDDLSTAMEMELEKNATLNIPPRTPRIQPSSSPVPADMNMSQHTGGDTNVSPLQSRVRRRSNSPSPSIASLASISTLSSIRSAPAAPLNTGAGSHFQRPPLIRSRGRGSTGNFRATGIRDIPSSNSLRSADGTGGSRTASVTMLTYPIEPSTEELVATCQAFLQRLRRGSSQHVRERLNTMGPAPDDCSLLSFWIAQLLPIDEGEKAKLLPIRSPRLRLRLVVHWIDRFNAAWSFSECVIS